MKTPANIKELFSYRLNRLAFLSSAIAETLNKQHYDLDKQTWRILGLLGAFQPMSLKALAREANLDKSRASKAVAALTQRGLVERKADEHDGRGIQLSLSETGQQLYADVFPMALRRNEEILEVLTPAQRAEFDDILDKLIFKARIMFDSVGEPKNANGGASKEAPPHR